MSVKPRPSGLKTGMPCRLIDLSYGAHKTEVHPTTRSDSRSAEGSPEILLKNCCRYQVLTLPDQQVPFLRVADHTSEAVAVLPRTPYLGRTTGNS